MNNNTDAFIAETASEYCLDFQIVKEIYDKYRKEHLFYSKLEEFLIETSNSK